MGALVLTRKTGESIRFISKITGQSAEITIREVYQHAIAIRLQVGENMQYVEIPYGVKQQCFGGVLYFETKPNCKIIRVIIDLPRDINVVRKELIK